MKIVEHYPPLAWGMRLQVESSESGLTVRALELISDQDSRASDVFHAYRKSISKLKGENRQSPHIEFANANDDDKLDRFVRRFGPIVVTSFRKEDAIIPSGLDEPCETTRPLIVGLQDWTELRNEQRMFHAAITLVAELQREGESNLEIIKQRICTINELAGDWVRQCKRERRLRMSGAGYDKNPKWFWGSDSCRTLEFAQASTVVTYLPFGRSDAGLRRAEILRVGHSVICELVNAFPALVQTWGETVVEAPHWDLSCGIRPVLYHLLRREYLSKSGIAVCRNASCRSLFEIERSEQHYCSDICSRKQRQREYWETTGKNLRDLRRLQNRKPALTKQRKRAK